MSTLACNELSKSLLSSININTLMDIVASRLATNYGGVVDHEELRGWAQLGITKAAAKFNADRQLGPSRDYQKRVCAWLLTKGYFEAIEEMRSAHLVSRTRYGVMHDVVLPMQQSGESDALNWSGLPIDTPDHNGTDPVVDLATMRDLVGTVLSHLHGHELAIFEGVYVHGNTPMEVSKMLGVSSARTYQIHGKLIKKIREFVNGNRGALCPNSTTDN